MSAGLARISLARVDIALALLASVSAEAICALALATDGGITDDLSPSSPVAILLATEDVGATSADLRCAWLLQWSEPCLTCLWSAEARSDFEPPAAFSVLAAACGGPAKHTKSPDTNINAERPLALIVIGNLPIASPRGRNEPIGRVHSGAEKGNLLATRGENGAPAPHRTSGPGRFGGVIFLKPCDGCQAKPINVMSLPGRNRLSCFPDARRGDPDRSEVSDHDFVIEVSRK